jgi:hypothetical protein
VDNEAESTADRMGGFFERNGKRLGTAIKGAAVVATAAIGGIVAATAGIVAPLVKSAASAQALGAQFEQVFGDAQKEAQKTVDSMGKEFGMVSNRLKPAFTQMTSMFKGLGMDTEEAMTTAKDAVTMAADAAAFYDKSYEDANAALNSFIKGNYEGGESIGLFANETQLASWAGKELGVEWKNLDEAGKQVARLEFAKAMQESAGATGQAARESNSLENQLGNLKQIWEDLKVKFGAPILEPAVEGIQKLAEWLQNVDTTPIVDFIEMVVSKIPTVKKILTDAFTVIKEVADVVWAYFKENIIPIFTEVYDKSNEYFPVIQEVAEKVFKAVLDVVTTVWDFFKKSLLPIFESLYKWIQGHMPTIRKTAETVFNAIKSVVSGVWSFFKNNLLPILASLFSWVQSKMPQIQRVIETVFKAVKNVVEVAWDIFTALIDVLKLLWDFIEPTFPAIGKIIDGAMSFVIDVVEGVINVFEKVTDVIKKAVDWLTFWNNEPAKDKSINVNTNYTSSGSSIAKNATGTNYFKGGLSLVGERGPELVELPKGSKIKTANDTRNTLGTNLNFARMFEGANFHVREETDINKIAVALGEKINSTMRYRGVKA